MSTNRYWDLQETALKQAGITHRLDASDQYEAIVGALVPVLAKLSEADLKAMFADYCQLFVQSYTSRLWAAAYMINGGCSDDGFDYFREWLILQGPTVYASAVADPDSLADVVKIPQESFVEFEGLMSAFFEAADQKGMDMDTCFDGLMQPYPAIDLSWEEDQDQLATLLPRLSAKINA